VITNDSASFEIGEQLGEYVVKLPKQNCVEFQGHGEHFFDLFLGNSHSICFSVTFTSVDQLSYVTFNFT
jgi:hypothetical protein